MITQLNKEKGQHLLYRYEKTTTSEAACKIFES